MGLCCSAPDMGPVQPNLPVRKPSSEAEVELFPRHDSLKLKLTLTFSCSNLEIKGRKSGRGTCCVLWKLKGKDGEEKTKVGRLGMTEVIHDNRNPRFSSPIEVDFFFEEAHQCRVEVLHIDDANRIDNATKEDLVGSVDLTLHQIITKRQQAFEAALENADIASPGAISIQA